MERLFCKAEFHDKRFLLFTWYDKILRQTRPQTRLNWVNLISTIKTRTHTKYPHSWTHLHTHLHRALAFRALSNLYARVLKEASQEGDTRVNWNKTKEKRKNKMVNCQGILVYMKQSPWFWCKSFGTWIWVAWRVSNCRRYFFVLFFFRESTFKTCQC